MTTANNRQVDGSHYRATIQHWDMTVRALDNRYLEGCVTKYVTRWRRKNGLADLQKADHYLEKLIEEATAGRVQPLIIGMRSLDLREYCVVNELTADEEHIVRRIARWRSPADLIAARATLLSMIREVSPASDDPNDAAPAPPCEWCAEGYPRITPSLGWRADGTHHLANPDGLGMEYKPCGNAPTAPAEGG